jgi:hypothetical protein
VCFLFGLFPRLGKPSAAHPSELVEVCRARSEPPLLRTNSLSATFATVVCQFATPSLETNTVGSPDCARSGYLILNKKVNPCRQLLPDIQITAQVCRARSTVCYTTSSHAAHHCRYYSETLDARSRLSPQQFHAFVARSDTLPPHDDIVFARSRALPFTLDANQGSL